METGNSIPIFVATASASKIGRRLLVVWYSRVKPSHVFRSVHSSSRQANFNGNEPYGDAEPGPYLRRTAQVGSYEPNGFGLYDLHGNVAEWCVDWYDPDYYTASPEESPRGPPVGVLSDDYNNFFLVVRGGKPLALRVAGRSVNLPCLAPFACSCSVSSSPRWRERRNRCHAWRW